MDLGIMLNSFVSFCTTVGIKLLVALIILIVGFKLIKMLTKALTKERKLERIDASVKSFLVNFTNIALKAILIIMVAGYIGIPMTSVITVLGSAAVAVGLSLQGSLSNLAGGIMIVIFKPFKVGDFIDAGSLTGTVSDIGIFYTKLKTPDGKSIVLPNGALSNQNIINYSDTDVRRVDFEFGVAYGSDTAQVKKILTDIALSNEAVLQEPAPFVGLSAHKDSSVNFVLRTWCKAEDYWNVYFAVNEAVLAEFDKAGISIPYPQMDVHMK